MSFQVFMYQVWSLMLIDSFFHQLTTGITTILLVPSQKASSKHSWYKFRVAMPFDPIHAKLQYQQLREKQCLAFCSVLRESYLVSYDLSALLAKKAPPAAPSTIAAVTAVHNSIKAIYLPEESAKRICDFAFPCSGDYVANMLKKCVAEQWRNYSRLPGKVVFNEKAKVGERVRESRYPWQPGVSPAWFRYGQYVPIPPRDPVRRGAITSLDCDNGSEIVVQWDGGTVSGGLKCGKKGCYSLVYDS